MNLLERIKSDDFIFSVGYEVPPKAIRYILARTEECKQLRDLYCSGNLSEAALRRYIQDLLGEFVPNKKFPYDMTLSLIAVALEPLYKRFADEYLSILASLELLEMPLSIRVAESCLQIRHKRTNNIYRTSSDFTIGEFNVCWEHFKTQEGAIDYYEVEAA